MTQHLKHKAKIKAKARVLVYGEGKTPGKDEPDEIKEGQEQILTFDNDSGVWRNSKGQFAPKPEKIAREG